MQKQEKNSVIVFKFNCNKTKQKVILEILLNYSPLDLVSLSVLLKAPVDLLVEVCKGTNYLDGVGQRQLAAMFLILFSD